MWQGIYKRWNPIPKLEGVRLYCAAVHDDREGFRIWLDGEPTAFLGMVIIRFENVLLYTNSDEGKRLNGIANIGDVQFPHAFWMVENSGLLKEFHRQSENIYENDEIIHYAFLTCDDCIDVLSWSKPTFECDVENLPQ